MINRIFFTFCSAQKDDSLRDSGQAVHPDVLYRSRRVKSFVARCREMEVRWAIFSDKYGVWFPETKHEWYEMSPDQALPHFARLLADFDEKMKQFDVIYFCPGVGGPRLHRLYRRLVRESRWNGRIKTTAFIDIS
jgi:hypothetical protein